MNKKGFTIIEVMVSAALLGIGVIILARFLDFNEIINEQIQFSQYKLYEAQDQMESRITKINKAIEKSLPVDSSWYVNDSTKVSLFGGEVDCYLVKGEAKDSESNPAWETVIALHTVIPKEQVSVKPAIPTISNAKLAVGGENTEAVYFADGANAKATANKPTDSQELSNFKKFLYQWYLTDDRYHAITMEETPKYMVADELFKEVYPRLPSDFDLLEGEDEQLYTVKNEDLGKVLACSITAGSKYGYMGNTLSTNHIYLSALPKLETGKYKTLIDPSVNTSTMVTDIGNGKITSEKPTADVTSGNFNLNGYGTISISSDTVKIAVDDEGNVILDELGNTKNYKTRYLYFDNDATIVSGGSLININNNPQVYIVAKSLSPDNGNVFAKISENGNYTDTFSFNPTTSNSWRLYETNFESLNLNSWKNYNLILGCKDLCVAEVLVVNNATSEENQAIEEYFSIRYNKIAKSVL